MNAPSPEIHQSAIVLCDSHKNLLAAALREAHETACKGATLFESFTPDSDSQAAGPDRAGALFECL